MLCRGRVLLTKTRLKEKLAKLEEEVKRLAAIEKALLASPDKCLHDSGDDVEYSISVLAFTVDFLAFVESDNRRENSQSHPFFCAEKLTHFPR